MPRLYETECVYCGAYAVLSHYCRQCEAHQPQPLEGYSSTWHIPNPKVDDAPATSTDESDKPEQRKPGLFDPLKDSAD